VQLVHTVLHAAVEKILTDTACRTVRLHAVVELLVLFVLTFTKIFKLTCITYIINGMGW